MDFLNDNLLWVIIGLIIWWTVAVFGIAIFNNSLGEFNRPIEAAYLMTLCLSWPVSIWFLIAALIYLGTVRSASQIRNDYRNRQVDKAFNDWYDKIGKDLFPLSEEEK